jgi:hypothetical protein
MFLPSISAAATKATVDIGVKIEGTQQSKSLVSDKFSVGSKMMQDSDHLMHDVPEQWWT